MNCTSCGTEIPFDERFCRNCGREVVPLAPTVFASGAAAPQSGSHITERFTDPLKTESINPPAQTAREWTPPPLQNPQPPVVSQDRKSMLVPITVASIVIALVSIGALAYIMLSKDKVDERVSTSPGSQPSANPGVSNSSATPTPTPQSTPSPTVSPTPTPKPTPSNEMPPGARAGYCNDTNVLVRSAPDLNARPVTKITKGQKLWVIATSTNYSTWNGINSNWTQVQLYNSSLRGWVFSPFVSY